MYIGNLPESLSQQILGGIILVGEIGRIFPGVLPSGGTFFSADTGRAVRRYRRTAASRIADHSSQLTCVMSLEENSTSHVNCRKESVTCSAFLQLVTFSEAHK